MMLVKFLAMLAVLTTVTVIFTLEYDDREVEQEYYCEMVREGRWPNYQEVECPKPIPVPR